MRKAVQILLILIGGGVAVFGFVGNNVWAATVGGIACIMGAVIWIGSPARPPNLDGGNRPTHDPINQTNLTGD